MAREASPIGHEEPTPQGYIRVKTAIGVWRLKHHLVAEAKLGRSLVKGRERVVFVDGNRNNYAPENINVIPVSSPTGKRRQDRIDHLRSQIEMMSQELLELEDSSE